jgi:hypothetical protein
MAAVLGMNKTDFQIIILQSTMSLNCSLLTSLLFIPHMIYESGEPWWNDADKEN